jgi:hypothetical protein
VRYILNKFIDMFRFITLPFDKCFHILILIYEKKNKKLF